MLHRLIVKRVIKVSEFDGVFGTSQVTGSDSGTYPIEGLVIGRVLLSGFGTKIIIYFGQNSYNCHAK